MAARMPDESYESLKTYVERWTRTIKAGTATVFALRSQLQGLAQHNETREHLRWKWHEFFNEYDVLLTPICRRPLSPRSSPVRRAHHHGGQPRTPVLRTGVLGGLTGVSYLPSTVIPTGLNAQGLPIGIQIVGPSTAT